MTRRRRRTRSRSESPAALIARIVPLTVGVQLLPPTTPGSFSPGAFERSALIQSLATGAAAEGVTRAMSLPTTGSPKNPKIDSHLVELSAADEAERAAGGAGIRAGNL